MMIATLLYGPAGNCTLTSQRNNEGLNGHARLSLNYQTKKNRVENSEQQCTTFSNERQKHDALNITLKQPLPNALRKAKYIDIVSSTPVEAESPFLMMIIWYLA